MFKTIGTDHLPGSAQLLQTQTHTHLPTGRMLRKHGPRRIFGAPHVCKFHQLCAAPSCRLCDCAHLVVHNCARPIIVHNQLVSANTSQPWTVSFEVMDSGHMRKLELRSLHHAMTNGTLRLIIQSISNGEKEEENIIHMRLCLEDPAVCTRVTITLA